MSQQELEDFLNTPEPADFLKKAIALRRQLHPGPTPAPDVFASLKVVIPIIEIFFALISLGIALKFAFDQFQRFRAEKKLVEAEKQAFVSLPESVARREKHIREGEGIQGDAAQLLVESDKALHMGSLFNLYSKQLQKYQTQTQSRAGWSFTFAILAMISGLALVVWGGTHIVFNAGWDHVAAGSLISIVGGALSAFITKTFLDVHRLSLVQLNNYFSQPVLNSHILTAQRLADLLPTDVARQKAYESIITKVTSLIALTELQQPTLTAEPPKRTTRAHKHTSGRGSKASLA